MVNPKTKKAAQMASAAPPARILVECLLNNVLDYPRIRSRLEQTLYLEEAAEGQGRPEDADHDADEQQREEHPNDAAAADRQGQEKDGLLHPVQPEDLAGVDERRGDQGPERRLHRALEDEG